MKKTFMLVSVLALAIGAAPIHASEALKAVVGSYLEIQARLATDKIDGIKPAAQAIGQQAARLGPAGENLAKAARSMEAAADIKAARDAFGSLSDAVIAMGTAEKWKDAPDVRVAYCPMVKRSWVQKGDVISNPYYGQSMLTCGEFKK
jgi:hypothetical protein